MWPSSCATILLGWLKPRFVTNAASVGVPILWYQFLEEDAFAKCKLPESPVLVGAWMSFTGIGSRYGAGSYVSGGLQLCPKANPDASGVCGSHRSSRGHGLHNDVNHTSLSELDRYNAHRPHTGLDDQATKLQTMPTSNVSTKTRSIRLTR